MIESNTGIDIRDDGARAAGGGVLDWRFVIVCAWVRCLTALTTVLPSVAGKPTINRLASGPSWTACERTGFHSGTAARAGSDIRPIEPPQASASSSLAIPGINTPTPE